MHSLFITGTDTDVGKTYITAGLAVSLRKMGYDVQVEKEAVECRVMAVAREGSKLIGVSDPRDAGMSVGQ